MTDALKVGDRVTATVTGTVMAFDGDLFYLTTPGYGIWFDGTAKDITVTKQVRPFQVGDVLKDTTTDTRYALGSEGYVVLADSDPTAVGAFHAYDNGDLATSFPADSANVVLEIEAGS